MLTFEHVRKNYDSKRVLRLSRERCMPLLGQTALAKAP